MSVEVGDTAESLKSLDLIWGAKNIGEAVNLEPRKAFHALETGAIPAKKVGGRWVADRESLRLFFQDTAK